MAFRRMVERSDISTDDLSGFMQPEQVQQIEETRANQERFNNCTTMTTDTIDTPVAHPDVARRQLELELLRERDNFAMPDGLGLVECKICAFGVFNASTQNSAMGRFIAVYYKQYGLLHPPQMFNYMTIFWNRDVRAEFPHVPDVTMSEVRFHFENCMQTQNIEQRLHTQLDRIERVQDVLESNGLFVECPDVEDEPDEPAASSISDEARQFIVSLDSKITALQNFMDQQSAPDAGSSSSTVARTGLSVETQGRLCHSLREMTSHLSQLSNTHVRSRKRKRVQVAVAEGHLFDKYCARAAQTARVLLDWKKYNETVDVSTRGLPSYCAGKKSQTGNLIDIYTGKKSSADATQGEESGEMAGTGEIAGRFAAY